ncbi:rhodanese-like domain-containing protein [Maribellus sediminis]|uniref:rhodanese-like domain-containing protein n=1 Tax=Maribellus sediminis TaxID=2696285 RepID=UPI001431DB8B|nr:rhodanese-like domain-containing protein [Maribellus sediminis]
MKKYIFYTLFLALVASISFTGCKYDDQCDCPENGADPYETLTSYLVENDMDLPAVLSSWITARPASADEVSTFIATYDIFDLRGETDYANGHIEGAVNVTLGNLLEKAASTTKPILAVCYTGQTASLAVVALRLSGYADAKVLMWGMSGWTSTLSGPWLANSGNENGVIGVGNANWTSDAVSSDTSHDTPELLVSATDGAGILEERVAALLENGFKGVASSAVLDAPASYMINNYWALADVEHYGHITGAHRINPLSIQNGEIDLLDPDKQICTYCWTGQTSSMITAYLNVLGFNAVSLKFGANSMIYSELESHKFVAPTVDYPVVK